jgi:hypothetical protein
MVKVFEITIHSKYTCTHVNRMLYYLKCLSTVEVLKKKKNKNEANVIHFHLDRVKFIFCSKIIKSMVFFILN